ncbi:MAG: hypothetical protein IJM58_10525 [Muribaculaceae bacterium]|nr:hypothetical protein [Muribaculaceae bacterium]
MKRKPYFATMLCLMMFMGMAATAQTQQRQRVCDIVKIEQTQQDGKKALPTHDQVMNNEDYNIQRKDGVVQYTPKHAGADVPSDSATVTLLYNLEEEDLGVYYVNTIIIYNLDWSSKWSPDLYLPDGTHRKGITVKIPIGTYDVYSSSVSMSNGERYYHIDELVTIDKDTTILFGVKDAENLVCWELCDENGELIDDNTTEAISGLMSLMLEGYGSLSGMQYSFRGGLQEGELHLGFTRWNTLSNRYHFYVNQNTIDHEGNKYVNHLEAPGSGPFPMKNVASDYVEFKEQFQRTPAGVEEEPFPHTRTNIDHFMDNSAWGSSAVEGLNHPLNCGQEVRVMVDAPITSSNQQLQGLNLATSLQIEDGAWMRIRVREYYDENDSLIFVRIDTIRTRLYTNSPMMMVRLDKKLEYVIYRPSVATPQCDVMQDEYPGHPRFGYLADQKKGIIGNCCPLNVVQLRNRLSEEFVRMINQNEQWGRNGEIFQWRAGGDYYSTLSAKYNGEEVYNGKMGMAVDSLYSAWMLQPRGEYELTFTNTNVAVDGIEGKNVTTIGFDQNSEDMNVPKLRMLQFRDVEDNVIDRFETPNNGIIMFSGGDFEMQSIPFLNDYGYESTWNYEECQPMQIEVSYAPYGTDEWLPLEGVEHQSEFDDLYFGHFYQGSLAGVNTPSENGWFDLKFRLVDEAGNWQEQTLSPAFRIDALVQSAVTDVKADRNTDNAIYNLAGQRMRGDLESLPHGIYIMGGKKVVK